MIAFVNPSINLSENSEIEVRSRRLMNCFNARDYVTLRKEVVDDEEVWSESSVGRSLLKSAPARVVRSEDAYRIDDNAVIKIAPFCLHRWGYFYNGITCKIQTS